jgi:hypothetical protein
VHAVGVVHLHTRLCDKVNFSAYQVTCLILMQDTLDNSPDPQSTIDFFTGLADGTDTAAGAMYRCSGILIRQQCRKCRQQHASQCAS